MMRRNNFVFVTATERRRGLQPPPRRGVGRTRLIVQLDFPDFGERHPRAVARSATTPAVPALRVGRSS
jgi:hypothetical protein